MDEDRATDDGMPVAPERYTFSLADCSLLRQLLSVFAGSLNEDGLAIYQRLQAIEAAAAPTAVATEGQRFFRWDVVTGRPLDRILDGPWGRYLIRKNGGWHQILLNGTKLSDGRGSDPNFNGAYDWVEQAIQKTFPEYANAQSIRP